MITNEMLDAYDTAILNHSPCADHTCDCGQKFKTTGDWHDHKISTALTAAAPHLRAAWGQPIRELCEAAIKRANDPLAARGLYGETFPATVYAQDILDLLEGGAEDK